MLSFEDLLRQLVAIASVSGDEGRISKFVADFCRAQGHEVWTVRDKAAHPSVAVRIRGRNRRCAFIYNAHLDTVPADWEHAYKLTLNGALLEGRGAGDMKAGVAVALYMAQLYAASISLPICDTWLMLSCEEETTANGSLDLVDWWHGNHFGQAYDRVAVVIMEPTGNEYVAACQKGGGRFLVEATGVGPCHGGTYLGGQTAAFTKLCRLGAWLPQWQRRLEQKYPSSRYGPPTVNGLRVVSALAEADNLVSDQMVLYLDLRTTLALGPRQLDAELTELERRYKVTIPHGSDSRNGGMIVCENAGLLLEAFAVGWPGLPEGVFPYAADMGAWREVGPTLICGPGDYTTLHTRRDAVKVGAMELFFERTQGVQAAFALAL